MRGRHPRAGRLLRESEILYLASRGSGLYETRRVGQDTGRAEYVVADDEEALDAFRELTKIEGIMPALETAHGLAYVKKLAPTMKPDQTIVVNVSGRGDKDINTVAAIEGIEL